MTDPGRPDAESSGTGREPEDPATSSGSDWEPQPGGTSSAPGELADLVTPKAPAPVWPAPGSVPPWSEPGSEPGPVPGSVPPASDPWAPGSAGSVQSGAVAPGSVPPGAWTGPEGTAGAPTAYGAVLPDGSTPPVGWTPPAAAPAKKGINIGGWLIRGGVIAAIVIGGLIFRDRLSGSATDLQVGDCFDEPVGVTEVSEVQHRPCNEGHDAEIFYVADYPTLATYPGVDAFDVFSEQNCIPAFEAYVGRDFETDTEFYIGLFYPLAEAWQAGDHEIACYVYRIDGEPLTTSVKV